MGISTELVLAAASGSTGGLGLIGTVPAAGVLYVRCDCDSPDVARIDWNISCNKANAVQLYRARSIVQSVTLTLAGLDDADTIVVNGLTFTAEDTLGDALAASRKFYTGGADDTADAVTLAALLNDATYGVPGLTATSAAAVVTLVPTTAPVIQAVVGTATTGECAIASTTLASLIRDGAAVSGIAADTTTGGRFFEQWTNKWPYAYIGITNNDAAAAATITVKATRYAA